MTQFGRTTMDFAAITPWKLAFSVSDRDDHNIV
jgi:hypothetical protein